MKLIDRTTWRFILVGIVNTLVGTGLMFFLYNGLGASYWLSSAANYVVGSIVSYFLNKYFTFQNKEKSTRQILYFALNIGTCYLLAYGIARPLVRQILSQVNPQTGDNIAMGLGMVLFVGLNYLGQRFFVFKSDH